MSEKTGPLFIHKKDPKLQLSGPVEHEQQRRKRAGQEISQKPAIRLSNWFEVLERTHLGRGASAERKARQHRVLEKIKDSYHKLFVIKPEEIPEEVFGLEVRIAREQGHGNIPPYEDFKEAKTQEFIAAQESSLDRWVDYLTSEDADAAGYPMWARYWAFMAVTKLGKLEKTQLGDGRVKVSFPQRDEGTVAPFPELNPKALAQTFAAMQHQLEQQGLPRAERSIDNTSTVLSDQAFAQMLSDGSFARIYAQFLSENPSITTERLKETRGEWVKYEHGSDASTLFESLQGHTLEWCTAGSISTAQSQVDDGDFYVYYSLDASGQPTIPRIAIRMENGIIAEIRGIEHDQHLDPYVGEVLQGKLKDQHSFPNAEEYMQGAEDMKLVTSIERKLGARYNDIEAKFLGYDTPDAPLTPEELRFIYELDREIVSLGYGRDPRIDQVLKSRDLIADMSKVFNTTSHNQIAQQLIEAGQGEAVARNLDNFTGLDHNQLAQQLIEAGEGWAVAGNLNKFTGLDNTTAQQLIKAGWVSAVANNLHSFIGLDNTTAKRIVNLFAFNSIDNTYAQQLIKAGGVSAVANNLNFFTGLDNTTAQQLIEAGELRAVANNLHKFTGLDNTTAQQLIEAGEPRAVANNLHKFTGLDNTTAQQLIEAGQGEAVARNLDNFTGLDHIQIAQQLIEAGQGWAVAYYLNNFTGLDPETLAEIEKYK